MSSKDLPSNIPEEQILNREIEEQNPGIGDIFDLLLDSQESENADLTYRPEFPINAGIATQDEVTLKIKLVIFRSNQTNSSRMSTQHAEKFAIEGANSHFQDKHFPPGTVLISTVEPCPMCALAYLNSLPEGQSGKIIFGARQSELEGKGVILAVDVAEEKGKIKIVNQFKPFRTEPKNYDIREFISDRNPNVQVIGPFRSSDVLKYMKTVDTPKK